MRRTPTSWRRSPIPYGTGWTGAVDGKPRRRLIRAALCWRMQWISASRAIRSTPAKRCASGSGPGSPPSPTNIRRALVSAQVTFGKGPHDHGFTCEIVAYAPQGVVLKATDRAAAAHAAFEAAADKVEKQLRRHTRRLKDHHAEARRPARGGRRLRLPTRRGRAARRVSPHGGRAPLFLLIFRARARGDRIRWTDERDDRHPHRRLRRCRDDRVQQEGPVPAARPSPPRAGPGSTPRPSPPL